MGKNSLKNKSYLHHDLFSRTMHEVNCPAQWDIYTILSMGFCEIELFFRILFGAFFTLAAKQSVVLLFCVVESIRHQGAEMTVDKPFKTLLQSVRRPVAQSIICCMAVVMICAVVPAGAVRAFAGQPQSAAPVAGVEVVRELDHDTTAFTQGLFFSGGRLFETTGRYGQSRIMELDPGTGHTLREARLPARYFGEGSVLAGGRILWLTWTSQVGFTLDPETFEVTGRFDYAGEGWGLTTDGTRLFMSDGSATITLRDPGDFHVLGSIEVMDAGRPVPRLNELEWAEGRLYANVWGSSRIAVIDPENGVVRRWRDLSALVPPVTDASAVLNGMAWDAANSCLLVTGKLWPRMFCVRSADGRGAP